MRSFLNWCGRWIAYIIAGATTFLAFWYVPFLRGSLGKVNAPITGLFTGGMPYGTGYVIGPVIGVVLLVFEALLIAGLLGVLLRRLPWLFGAVRVVTAEALRYAAMIGASAVNIALALYLSSVFWEGRIFGVKLLPADTPASVGFSHGMWILQIMSWYLVLQCIPLFFRPRMSVTGTVVDFVTSSVPVVVIAIAWGNFWFDSPSWGWWTPYRQGWLAIWPLFIVDLANIVVAMRLLTRGFIASEDVIRTGGHHL